MRGSQFCYFHNPDIAEKRRVASINGGKSRKAPTLPENAKTFKVKDASDVVSLLSETINHLRRGELDPRIGNAIGYLSGIILRAREQAELEERLEMVEKSIGGLTQGFGANVEGKDFQAREIS